MTREFNRIVTTTPSAEISAIDEGRGRPVVLLHGAPMTSIGFSRVIEPLGRNYRVVAPDLPGFGASRASADFDDTLGAYAESIAELIEALDLNDAVLYLNDSSACMGLAAAAKVPHRIAGLVVADTVPIPLDGRAWLIKMILRHVVGSWPVRALNRRFNLLPWLVSTVAPLFRPLPRRLRRAMRSEFDSPAKRDRIIDVLEAVGRDDDFMRETAHRVRERLSQIPTLILYGQLDPMRLVGGPARFAELLPRSSRVTIRLEEHFPILGSGARVAAELHRWIEREVAVSGRLETAA